MTTATLVKIGNSEGITIPKPFRLRNGLTRGSRVRLTEASPTRLVIEAEPPREGRHDALLRALKAAGQASERVDRSLPEDAAGIRRLLGDRDA